MIPVLYDKNDNCIGPLADCTRCYVTQERNGIFEAEIDYPMSAPLFSQIESGGYIVAKPDDISQPQKMRIYKPSKPLYGTATFYTEHIRYSLGGVPVARGQYSGTPAAVLGNMATSVDSNTPFTFWSDISNVHDINLSVPSTVGKMLAGTEGSVLDVFGGEYEFDNYTVKLHRSRGRERTTEIRYAKNLTGFTCESDISNTYTSVYPFYYNEMENSYVELPYKKIVLSGASSLPFSRCYMLDLSQEWETAPTAAQLEAKAQQFISRNKLDEIHYSYRVSFIPLWQTNEYKNISALERCGLCDTVSVIHEKTGTKIRAKIVKTVYDSLAERYVEMELGNATRNFASTVVQEMSYLSSSIKTTKSFVQIVVASATSRITGNQGGFVVLYDSDGDGEPDEILIMNTPSILTATKVWRWNASGLGYSSHGYAGPYETAITMDGAIVADFITTGSLNASLIRTGVMLADLIKAGTISDKTNKVAISLENGLITMKIDNGTEMQLWTNGLTFYGDEVNGSKEVLASMFVSSNKKGVVTSNFILVGTRDHERTIIRDGHITLNGDGSTLGNVMIGCENINIEDQNGNIIGSFFKNLYGGTTLKINELYVDNAKYTPANITVNGTTYTVLCSNVNIPT